MSMTKEELKTREKLKLTDIAKEWLRTEHWEGNIQSLVNLILRFTEPKDRRIAELEVTNKKISDECHKLVDSLEKKQKEVAELEEKLKLLSKYVSDLYVLGYSSKKITELVHDKIAGILGGKENG